VPSHLIDSSGTVEPNIDPKGIEDRVREQTFFWLDLERPNEADFEMLTRVFGLHPLALEDSRKFNQRPKIEDYKDYTFLVVFGAVDDPATRAGLSPIEVHCFFSAHWLITVHKGERELFADLRDRDAHRLRRFEQGLGILYLVLDSLVDSFFPQLSELDEAIDQLEDDILENAGPEQLQQAIAMKRQLVQLRKLVHPQQDMFASLLSGRYELPGMDAEHEHYFRDIYDHIVRIHDISESLRDLIAGTLETYLSVLSNRTNDIMKTLTIVTVMFMPMSFLVGFFGMNFFGESLAFQSPLPKQFLFVVSLLVMCVSPSVMWVYMRRKKWF